MLAAAVDSANGKTSPEGGGPDGEHQGKGQPLAIGVGQLANMRAPSGCP
jgi:hypothetical protein